MKKVSINIDNILKKNKKILIGVMGLMGLLLVFVILIIILNLAHNREGNIKGDFKEDNAHELNINGLKAYAPEKWVKDEYKEGGKIAKFKKYNDDNEYIASIKIVYMGNDNSKETSFKRVSDEFNINVIEIPIMDCDFAGIAEYNRSEWNGLIRNSYEGEIYVVNLDRATFAIVCETYKDIYDENEFSKIINSIQFDEYENKKLCKTNECLNKKLEGLDYCQNHKCHKESCIEEGTKEILTGNIYCAEHINICFVGDCNNAKIAELDYCEAHKCAVSDCTNSIKDNEMKYCAEHQCTLNGCNEKRIDNGYSLYCINHKCKASECSSQAEEKGYCSMHAKQLCTSNGCNNLKVEMKKYCSTHLGKTLSAGTYIVGSDFEYGTYNLSLISGTGNVYCYDAITGRLTINEIFGSSSSWGQIKNYENLDMNAGDEFHIDGGVKIKLTWAQ
ncbi:MAG: hypothetical protein ACLSAO_08700 [Anaerovoracaceae bacterium]